MGMNGSPMSRHQNELTVAACDGHLGCESVHAQIKAEKKRGS